MPKELLFKSVLDHDPAPIVLCGQDHEILYMNPKAREIYPGLQVGNSILTCHSQSANQKIIAVIDWFKSDPAHQRIHTYYNPKENKDVYMVALRDDENHLIGYYEKHEFRDRDPASLYDFYE